MAAYLVVMATTFAVLVLKRPDALLLPQFFAEDGRIFFHDQLVFGAAAMWMPYAGYLLLAARAVAVFASWGSVGAAPLIYNTAALLIAAASCAMFSLPAFNWIVRSRALRIAASVLMAAALDSGEIVGSITQMQWYGQIAAVLLVAHASRLGPDTSWRLAIPLAVLTMVVMLSGGPMVVAAAIATLSLISRVRTRELLTPAALPELAAVAGAGIQVLVYRATSGGLEYSSAIPSSGLLPLTAAYLSFRAVLTSLLGRETAIELLKAQGLAMPTIAVTVLVGTWLAWLWQSSDRTTRSVIVGCLGVAVVSAGLAVGLRGLPGPPQDLTFGGERYFFLASCCGVVLAAITLDRRGWRPWIAVGLLAALFSGGVVGNFSAAPFTDRHWPLHSERIRQWIRDTRASSSAEAITVPLNPDGWFVVIEGRALSNGGFEGPYALPWVGQGDIGMSVTREARYQGQGSLMVSGTVGDVRQLVWGVPGPASMRSSASVLMPCGRGLSAALVITARGGRVLARADADGARRCGAWQTLTTTFALPPDGRVVVRLLYSGTGDSILWDDVALSAER